MKADSKEEVLRAFLAFVGRFVPLSEARLATLGGYGIEARLWHEAGIPPSNGWLIERNRARNSSLVAGHRYQTHNQLATLPKILAGYGEGRNQLDAFHLDLCGTVSADVSKMLEALMPVLLRSRGRCLAITVADARANQALSEWPTYEKAGKKILSEGFSGFFETLLAQQKLLPVSARLASFMRTADPVKGAKREFGMFMALDFLMEIRRTFRAVPYAPGTIERYVYVSRYNGHPFRMRTYFFRFEPEKFDPHSLSTLWKESPLFFGRYDRLERINIEPKGVNPHMSSTSKLAALANLAGGDILAEYQALVARAKRYDEVQALIGGASLASLPIAAAPSVSGHRRKWDDLSKQEQIMWTIAALEKRAAANGAWSDGAWEKMLSTDFGRYSKKLGRQLRAVLARAAGRFRPGFRQRIQKVFGEDAKLVLERYNKIADRVK